MSFKTVGMLILLFILVGIIAGVAAALLLGAGDGDNQITSGSRGDIVANDVVNESEPITTPMPTTLRPSDFPTFRPSQNLTPTPSSTTTSNPTERLSERFQDLYELIGK